MGKIKNHISDKAFDVFNYAFFIVLSFIMLYPFWYVIMFSLSDPTQSAVSNYYFIPQGFTLETYKYMLSQKMIYIGYKNTIFVASVGTFVSLFLTFITAYPLSREKLKGKNMLLRLIIFTMLFDAGMIPNYIIVRGLHLTNTLWALIIPSAINVFYLMIMIKFLKGIPVSLIESAKIEGCSEIGIMFKIILPLSGAALASIALFYTVDRWNSFYSAVIYNNDRNKDVLQVVIRNLFQTETMGEEANVTMQISTPEHFRMATIIITVLPILMVYPYVQKYFVKGVSLGSVKG